MAQTKVLIDTLPEPPPRLPTVAELLAELKHAEWLGQYQTCPRCWASQDDGHKPDCSLAAALAKAKP